MTGCLRLPTLKIAPSVAISRMAGTGKGRVRVDPTLYLRNKPMALISRCHASLPSNSVESTLWVR